MPIIRSRIQAARRVLRRQPTTVVPPDDGPPPEYTTTKKWSELSPLPTAGSSLTIPSGWNVILDVVTPALNLLTVQAGGKLSSDPVPAQLGVTAETILVEGVWEIGTEAQPYTKPYTITMTGAKPTGLTAAQLTQSMVRSIQVNGGKLLWWGDVTRAHRSRLGANAATNATAMTMAIASLNWKSGDEIAVSPTEFYNIGNRRTQRMTLAANSSGAGITTTTGLATSKYGVLQYVTDAGLSLTPGTITPDANWPVDTSKWAPSVLDERAMVINLTRNIVVQGANDTAWTTDGWGADVMVMGQAQNMKDCVKVSGVLFRRCGKRGVLGKYPFHWHMVSYESYNSAAPTTSGKAYYGLVEGHFVRDCAFVDSANRAVVVHGTNGTVVERNVACTISGHAFFLENGSEMWNTLRDNVALNVTDPHPGVADTSLQFNPDGTRTASGVRLAKHEAGTFVAGYWITNPKNDLTGNWAADCGIGMWFSFSWKTFGPSRNVLFPGTTVPMKPSRINHGVIDGNFVQGCARYGAATALVVQDESGTTADSDYSPKQGDLEGTPGGAYALTGMTIVKCGTPARPDLGAYLNRVFTIHYQRWIVADNMQLSIHGSAEGTVEACTMMGRTLNQPTARTEAPFVGVATYHFSVGQENCMFVNIPFSADSAYKGDRDVGGGGVSMVDLYLSAVEIGPVICRGAKYISSHAGYRCKPPWLKGMSGRYFTFSGAMWDPHGDWGRAGSYMVYGNYAPHSQFFTYGLSDAVATEPAANSGTVDTMTRYFGVQSFRNEQNPVEFLPYMPLNVERLDNATSKNVVGQWFVQGGASAGVRPDPMLPQMRHFAAANGGIYRWTYPYTDGISPQAPSQYHAMVIQGNQWEDGDFFVLGAPWDANTVKVYTRALHHPPRSGAVPYLDTYATTTAIDIGQARLAQTAVTTLAEVADPVGNADCLKVFNDRANKCVWFAVRRLVYPGEGALYQVPYPLALNPTKYLEKHRMNYTVTILP